MSQPELIPPQQALDWCIRIRHGDEAAFRQLFDAYYAPLCRYAISLTGEPDLSEDVVQSVFVWIWEERETWRLRESVRGYLYRAVYSRVVSRWRAAGVRDAYVTRMQAEDTIVEDGGGLEMWPDRAAQYAELQSAYWRAVAALPPRGRRAFELQRQHGLSSREIGEVMGISPRTVETHIGRALLALREALAVYVSAILILIAR